MTKRVTMEAVKQRMSRMNMYAMNDYYKAPDNRTAAAKLIYDEYLQAKIMLNEYLQVCLEVMETKIPATVYPDTAKL